MASAIKIKRSAVQGKVPSTTDLQLGELAVNTYDGKLFLKKDNGTEAVVEIGSESATSVSTKIPFYVASGAASHLSQVLVAGTAYVPFFTASGTAANIPMVI